MEKNKKPIVSILRSSNDDYLSPLINPDAAELSGDAFLTNPVASACDCTGIAVTVPMDAYEARSVANLAHIPVTALEETDEDREMPPRDRIHTAE